VPSSLEKLRLRLAKGTVSVRRCLVQDLEAMGFRRVTTVTESGEFSARGGIVDVYGFGMASATRALEWWDDEVSSLRRFDLTTQRSGAEIDEITVLPIKAVEVGEDGSGRTGKAAAQETCGARCSTCCRVMRSCCSTRRARSTTRSIAHGAEAAHHLEIARRLGEDVPEREEILEAPPAVRARMNALPRLGSSARGPSSSSASFRPRRSTGR
jgi:transcription-repair coupling factor (superfamily II helicase)